MKVIKSFFVVLILIFGSKNLFAQDLKVGPFSIESVNNRFYLKIADSLVDREILVVTRVVKGSTPQGKSQESIMFPGTTVKQVTIRFTKGKNGTVQLEEINHRMRDTQGNPEMSNAIAGYNQFPILGMFYKTIDSVNNHRIDFTDFLLSENALFGMDSSYMRMFKLENLQPTKSEYIRCERFPAGIDIRLLRTYSSAGGSRSVQLNTTFLVLSENPLMERLTDHRVTAASFNVIGFTDFSCDQIHEGNREYSYRYRLIPSEKDRNAYQNGKLVTPEKPILFYLDPNTPHELISPFSKAILAWNHAFEKAGFRDAVQVKMAPKSEEDFNYFSARYNAVDYLASIESGGNANLLVDQRSGEIMSSRIRIPHKNVNYLHNRYMVLAGALDPEARRAKFSPELTGQLMAAMVSHEVGHCLGLHHNYLSSALVPVEKLRDKNWVEQNGLSPSIMDYSRVNYVAQPEDKISREGLIPKIGVYDLWAVEWLYKWFGRKNAPQEKEQLDQLFKQRLAENPMIQYLFAASGEDSRQKMEDLGNDAVSASLYGIKNLKRVVPHILEWTQPEPEINDYEYAFEVYFELTTQYRFFMEHVAANIGGKWLSVNETNSYEVTRRISKTDQKKAIDFLASQLFETPEWMLPPQLLDVFSIREQKDFPPHILCSIQDLILSKLVADQFQLMKMRKGTTIDPEQYSCNELLTDLENHLFKEFNDRSPITPQRRHIQNTYVTNLGNMLLILSKNDFFYDERIIYAEHLKNLEQKILDAQPLYADKLTKMHLKELLKNIYSL